jgi:pimeloyl-ACP methyl ester carboxylesterase
MLTHFWRLPAIAVRTGLHPIRPDGYARQLAAVGGFEAGGRLPVLKIPTLVIHGDQDILLPPENGRILSRLIPGARLVIYEGAAHGFSTESPRLFARTVRDFVLEGAA